jgi:8-oxo-dGTP pyrophosphatase MutT (NUDIX family)
MSQTLVQRLQARLEPIPSSGQEAPGHAAVLIALTDRDEPDIWLIRRSLSMMLHPGQMAFPGGKGEHGDRCLLDTALREAEEEVALPRASFTPCGTLTARRTMTGYTVSPFVGVVPVDLVLRPSPDEVDAVMALPLRAFADAAHLCIDQVSRAGIKRAVPRFQVEGCTVWGMTASLIVELVNRVCDAGYPAELHVPPQFPIPAPMARDVLSPTFRGEN